MPVRNADGVELKFNPYHDPRNGRFTFAPGGAGGVTATRRAARLAGQPSEPIMRRGSNSRAFEDPMTLEQVFPGPHGAVGGAVTAVGSLFDITGPATEVQAELLQNWTRQAIADIKALDPRLRSDSRGTPAMPTTLGGMTYQLDNLRWQRAVIIARMKGDYRPLQVETLRFVQRRANMAYDEGQALLRAGKLTPGFRSRRRWATMWTDVSGSTCGCDTVTTVSTRPVEGSCG